MQGVGGLQVNEDDLEVYFGRIRDTALKHALQYGVAFLYDTQPPAEQEVVMRLFQSGAVQVQMPSHLHSSKATGTT